ncbi:MAG: hypothetical protein ABJB21_11600 [bacterium]
MVGSNAISVLNDKVYFHSPYDDETGVYEWQIGKQSAERVGSYPGRLRGLSDGKFLAVEKAGYVVISPPEI